MKDQSKTKQVLIQELAILRQRVEELEQSESEWKKEREESKRSESLFRSYFDLPLYGIAITSPEKGWIQVNDRICSIMGYSRDEIVCKTWSEMTHPDDLAANDEQFSRVLSGKIDQYNMDKRFIRKDGGIIWTNISVGCVRKSDGSVDHMVCVVEDITSARLEAEALRQERILYEDLVTAEPAGVYRLRVKLSSNWQEEPWSSIVESMYSVDMASDRYCNILGISREEFMTNAGLVRDLIHPDDKQDFDVLNMEAMTHLSPFTWEGRIIRNQQTKWIHFESLPRVLDSETVLWTGIVYDITERKQMEEALQVSETKYRNLYQSMMDAYVSTDMEGYIRDYNRSYLNILGYAPEEISTLTYKDITPEKWHMMEEAIVKEQVLINGYSDIYEKEYRRKDGTIFPVELRTTLLRDIDGKPISMWAIVRDVTERKQAEEVLKESEIRFRELFNNMSSGVAIYEAKNDGTEFIFKDINKTSMRINGVKQEDVVGRFVTEVFPGIGEMGLLDVFRRVWKTSVAEYQQAAQYNDARLYRWYENRVYKLPSGEIVAMHDDVTERKEAENELKRFADEISDLYNNAPCGYHSLDSEGTFIRINDTQLRWLGYTRDELIGKKRFPDIMTPGSQESFKNNYPLFRRQGRIKDAEYELIRKDGSILPVILNATAINDEEGNFLLSRASLFDNTERKLADEALQASEAKYRFLFESVGEGITIAQGDKIRFANDAVVKLLGHPKDIITTRPFLSFTHPDDRAMVLDRYSRRMKGEAAETDYAYKIITADGTEKWIHVFSKLIAWEGAPAVMSFVIDITERRQTEEKIHEISKRLQLATASAKGGVWDWNLQTNEMIWDDRMLELYGLTHENFPGGIEAWEQGLHPDDSFRAIQECQAALRGEKDFDTEFRVLRPDGTVAHIKANGLVLRDKKEQPLRMIGLNTDITEHKQAANHQRELEERLQRAEKMEALGTLAGGVAHDLNNVLGIVVGYAEMLLDEIDEASPLRNDAMKIMEGGQRSAAIVQDLLTLARRGVSGRKVLNLNKLILDYKKSPEWERLLSYHPSVQIKTDLEADLLNISASSVHLEKALFNLVSNACEAMAKGGCVTIRTINQYLDKPVHGYDNIREGDYVLLSVSDTGEGIPESDLNRIFEPFYTKKVMGRSGTGLGLAVVWGTVKDHQGYINVESEEGKGTRFTLYFPVAREDITAESLSMSINEYMGRGESILVVDDVKGQRDLAAAMLKKLNYKVASVSSGEDAVEYLREQDIDLMVLDMIMDPGMDGLDTYRNVLKIHPKQKAIIVSGFSESDRVHDAQALGAGAYVRKPYVIEKLGLAVREELDRI